MRKLIWSFSTAVVTGVAVAIFPEYAYAAITFDTTATIANVEAAGTAVIAVAMIGFAIVKGKKLIGF